MLISGLRYQPKPLKHGDRDTCTCPHCWTVFPLEDALYVSRHPELRGDPMLGRDVSSRFKPTRFTAEGQAIDPGGYPCLELACPACHLEIPRSISEYRSLFLSIVGMAQSGKSFFLTSLAWELRRVLGSAFAMSFTDLDGGMNEKLHSYEQLLFFAKDPDEYVTLPKTEQQGELYNRVNFDDVETLLPKPFMFTLRPQAHHPEEAEAAKLCRTLVLYDNAGEHFNPNQDTATQPGTMHMARSECLFFMFDPTQDPRFRERIKGKTTRTDPQIERGWHNRRQDVCFNEAARRIRRHVGMATGTKYRKQVIVVVNKFDLWQPLLNIAVEPEPYRADANLRVRGLIISHVEDVSFSVRALLLETCPEVVNVVEDFAEKVTYIPVSTIGHSPIRKDDGGLYVRPADVRPFWAAVPFLYAFARLGLIHRAHRNYPDSVPRATLVRQVRDVLVCDVPGADRLEIPVRLAGKLLHHPKTAQPFIVPIPGDRNVTAAAPRNGSAATPAARSAPAAAHSPAPAPAAPALAPTPPAAATTAPPRGAPPPLPVQAPTT